MITKIRWRNIIKYLKNNMRDEFIDRLEIKRSYTYMCDIFLDGVMILRVTSSIINDSFINFYNDTYYKTKYEDKCEKNTVYLFFKIINKNTTMHEINKIKSEFVIQKINTGENPYYIATLLEQIKE